MSELSLSDAAKHFKVSQRTIRRWIQANRLSAEKVNGHWVIHMEGGKADTPFVQSVTPNVDLSNRSEHAELEIHHLTKQVEEKTHENHRLHEYLTCRDEQLNHAQQLLAVAQKSIQQLTQQNQLLLENKRTPLWKRLFQR